MSSPTKYPGTLEKKQVSFNCKKLEKAPRHPSLRILGFRLDLQKKTDQAPNRLGIDLDVDLGSGTVDGRNPASVGRNFIP